jgi:hypothetical protein
MTSGRKRTCSLLIALLLVGGACKKKEGGSQDDGKAVETGKLGEAGKAALAGQELADAAEPAAVTWKRIAFPFGTVELPIDPGWNLVGTQVQGPAGEVIMLQSQDGIEPSQLDEYLTSYGEVQRRDAPKYEGPATAKGAVGGKVAARVEGTFDNGTKFTTRDFLIFHGGKVVALSARAPSEHAAKLAGIIDHVARTLDVGGKLP